MSNHVDFSKLVPEGFGRNSKIALADATPGGLNPDNLKQFIHEERMTTDSLNAATRALAMRSNADLFRSVERQNVTTQEQASSYVPGERVAGRGDPQVSL